MICPSRVNALHARGKKAVLYSPSRRYYGNDAHYGRAFGNDSHGHGLILFHQGGKKQYIPYEQYPEFPVHDDIPDTDGTSHAHGHSHTQTKAVMNRLARISGHLEAIKRMVEDGGIAVIS